MFALRQLLAIAFMGMTVLLPLTGLAETYGEIARTCQNGDKIKDLDKRISKAAAMQDNVRYQFHFDEAREYFLCSKTAMNTYTADIATLLSWIELNESARTDGEEDERGHMAASAENKLAAATLFDDIREQALKFRDLIRKQADESHNAIYGP